MSSGLSDLVGAGVLSEVVELDSHPTRTLAQEPFCTRSQILRCANDDGRIIARVHRYLRTDGTLGASGKPDPKYLLIEGVIYKEAPRT